MKKSFNPIPKSIRDKHRYVKINHVDDTIKQSIIAEYNYLYGVINSSKAGIKFEKDFIKVNSEHLEELIYTINTINIKSNKEPIKVVNISGTIEGLN